MSEEQDTPIDELISGEGQDTLEADECENSVHDSHRTMLLGGRIQASN